MAGDPSCSRRALPCGAVERVCRALEAAPSVRWAYLFGSAACGGPARDLDVALMLDEGARGAIAIGTIAAALEAASGRLPVDVVDLRSAAPRLAGRIVREGRVLVDRDPPARRRWQLEANRRALDIEPWLARFERLRRRALLERAADGRRR